MRLILALCSYLSYLCASVHYGLVKGRICPCPAFIRDITYSRHVVLHSVWYSRIVRRVISFLIRTPAKKSILRLISPNISTPPGQGCVITMCRSPWKRLMVQWCLFEHFALVVTDMQYHDTRSAIHRKGRGISEVRDLIRYLQAGGRVVAILEYVNSLNSCPIEFMGSQQQVSLFVERIATLANVPIVINIPRLSGKSFDFIPGPLFPTSGIKPKEGVLTRQIISFFESEIKTNPAIWAKYAH